MQTLVGLPCWNRYDGYIFGSDPFNKRGFFYRIFTSNALYQHNHLGTLVARFPINPSP